MPIEPSLFSQVMQLLPLEEFRKCVKRYRGQYKVRRFSCLDHFLCLAFAQLTHRASLRDIETTLRAMRPNLYHMGIRGHVARSTLADANEHRDWRIYAEFAHVLIAQARTLYRADSFGIELEQAVFALDSTTIDLCLSLFPWARYQRLHGAIKVHTLLNLRGDIPEFIHVSNGKMADVRVLDLLVPIPGSLYVMDRGYGDFKRLYRFQQSAAFFVTRARRRLQFQRHISRPVDKQTGLRCDQTVVLTGVTSATDYPEPVRRIRYVDQQTQKGFVFLTNETTLPALVITQLYKARWRVELFFKWIKQHMQINTFYGTSENAVKTQVWIAVSTYVFVAILKKRLQLKQSLYTILQILNLCLFEKRPILQVFSELESTTKAESQDNQLLLFNL